MHHLRPPTLLLLLAVAAWSSCCEGCSKPASRPNVVLVLVDTLRADRVGAFGGTRALTPSIDTWAAGAHVFRAAFAHAPWTLPSTASLMTSTYPEQHGAGGEVPRRAADGSITGGFTRLADGLATVAERFESQGWRTGCVINVDFLGRNFGLTRGFADVDDVHFEDNDHVRDAGQTTTAALAWVDERDERPSFLLVHYFDPHAVYAPPAEFRRRYALPADREDPSFRFPTREQMGKLRAGYLELDPEDVERAEHLYDAEVAYVDSQVGRLIDGLRSRGLFENTIVVFTADHGEEFLDHGGFEHGHTLYDELLHVPLAISWPEHVPSGESQSLVGLIDVAPTLCELAGIAPAPTFLGHTLSATWNGSPVAKRALLAHGNFWGPPLSSLRQEDDQLILGPANTSGNRAVELYGWRADPRESKDRSKSEAALATTMRARLESTEQALAKRTGTGVQMDQEFFERMKALGYAGEDDAHEE